jgi:hypothetical protein
MIMGTNFSLSTVGTLVTTLSTNLSGFSFFVKKETTANKGKLINTFKTQSPSY